MARKRKFKNFRTGTRNVRISRKDVHNKKAMLSKAGYRERTTMNNAHHIYSYKSRGCNLITFISDKDRCTWDCDCKEWTN